VQIDNKAAAVEAMEHLYRLGHRHIGLSPARASVTSAISVCAAARERAKKEQRATPRRDER
jgi:DNA-binding LacI/PurR family transcriptional regulator